jgi:hypothetical protein
MRRSLASQHLNKFGSGRFGRSLLRTQQFVAIFPCGPYYQRGSMKPQCAARR